MTAREVCPGCGGSGQISYFKGVSRFLLSCEECPECAGLGVRFDPEVAAKTGSPPKKARPKKKTKEKRS